MTKLLTHRCAFCGEEFKSTARNVKYCSRKECKDRKKKEQRIRDNEKRLEDNRSTKKKMAHVLNRKCIHRIIDGHGNRRVCGRNTGKNYFFCPRCLPQIQDNGVVGV